MATMSPARPGIDPSWMVWRGADLRVEQRARRDGRERPDDRLLERDHLVVRDGLGRVRPQLAAQVLAMVQGEDRERAALRRAGAETASALQGK